MSDLIRRETRELARKIFRGSIVELALCQFLSQAMEVAAKDKADAIEALQARAEQAEAELREARLQMLSDAGQAAEAYEAQLRAEAACNAVMKDRAQIMQQRDAALASVERMRHE